METMRKKKMTKFTYNIEKCIYEARCFFIHIQNRSDSYTICYNTLKEFKVEKTSKTL